MCRWFIYKGTLYPVKSLIYDPENALLKQTYNNPIRSTVLKFNEENPRDHRLNVDGYGMAWYVNEKKEPYLYRKANAPWHDSNLNNLCEYIYTPLIFAHIRAIKPFSKYSLVHEYNCHPFRYSNIVWMHNGEIKDSIKIIKYVYNNCSDYILQNIKGNTDSEYCFCIYLDYLEKHNIDINKQRYVSLEILRICMKSTIDKILDISGGGVSSLNFAITDGNNIVATRFINSQVEEPPSLYYSLMSDFCFKNKKLHMGKGNECIILASEPINIENNRWKMISKNKIITISKNNNIKFYQLCY